MLAYCEETYEGYTLTAPQLEWIEYFVSNFIGGTDVVGRTKDATFDFEWVKDHF